MFLFLYHYIWTIALIFFIPVALLSRRKRLFERLSFRRLDHRLGQGNIWIHALSVGEVISAIPLIDALCLKFPDRDIVFTVSTSKGLTIAQRELGTKIKALLTMPVDFWWCIHRLVKYIRPSIFVLVETDIWPGLTSHLKKRGIKTILINGRVSPRAFRSYLKARFVVRKVFEPFELCLMQTDLDRRRLLCTGILPSEKVRTTGNIKFDRRWESMRPEEHREWLNLLKLDGGAPVWVAGSTHQGEEEALLRVFVRLHNLITDLRLILAPRNIERSPEILKLAQSMGMRGALRSRQEDEEAPYEVLILDTIGELGRVYGLGTVSFVGGSLVSFGGHNLLEPASFGCPVLFGPHTHNFVLMSELLLKEGGGRRVRDEEDLYEAMQMLLEDTEKRTKMGFLAKGFVEKNRGALERVLSHITENL
jgi:3-deoxy-D-manno-octulosonic-acid transferase